MSKTTVVWLCPFPVSDLSASLQVDRKKRTHASSWIINLRDALVQTGEVELHILTVSPYVKGYRKGVIGSVNYHIIRSAFPFTLSGYPRRLNYPKWLAYSNLHKPVGEVVKRVQPDLLHAHGVEGPYALLASRFQLPTLVSIQGILKLYKEIGGERVSKIDLRNEYLGVLGNTDFGCRTAFDKGFVESVNSNASVHFLPEVINPVYFQKKWRGLNKRRIVFIGSLIPRKGLHLLIDAVSHFSNLAIDVIGEGDAAYKKDIKNKVNGLADTVTVEFHGFLEPDRISEILRNATIFCLPTSMDNSPNSLAEAMAVGVPSVATEVGGIPSMISDGQTGLLFELNNVSDLRAKLSLIFDDKELAARLSSAAKERAFDVHSSAKVAKMYIDVYRLISRSNG